MYKVAFQVNLTDWMDRPDLLPMGKNVDWLTRGLVETPGREYQPSYNQLVRFLFIYNNCIYLIKYRNVFFNNLIIAFNYL